MGALTQVQLQQGSINQLAICNLFDRLKMWSLLLLVPILSASPQLKYVESAVHFKGEVDNDSVNKTATVNNQEKAAALNTVYQSPAAELGNYHADHEAANVDHQVGEDCCCSASLETNHPGLRIVNRPPKTHDHHHHHQHQAPTTRPETEDMPAFGLLQEEVPAGSRSSCRIKHPQEPGITLPSPCKCAEGSRDRAKEEFGNPPGGGCEIQGIGEPAPEGEERTFNHIHISSCNQKTKLCLILEIYTCNS